MPENSDSTPTRSFGLRARRRDSVAPREAVLGLDSLERGISLFGASIALVLALVTAVEWARNLPVITTIKHVRGEACPKAYPTLVNSLCEHITKTSRSEWEVRFFFILLVALCILWFALRRKRAGVACFAVFLGLGLGIESGLVFFFLGAWLIVRAYRLQKYGVPTMLGSNRVAKEKAAERREGRSSKSASSDAKSSSKPTPSKPATPEASKRYTPKRPPPRRRS
ncbi:MAG: hypothetical protein WCA31_09425 [Acidimicrobiales bacterium]